MHCPLVANQKVRSSIVKRYKQKEVGQFLRIVLDLHLATAYLTTTTIKIKAKFAALASRRCRCQRQRQCRHWVRRQRQRHNNFDDDCFDRFLTYFLNSRNCEYKKEKEKMLECSRRFGSPFS